VAAPQEEVRTGLIVRYGVIADIHANLPALQTAMEVLTREGTDAFVCLGDLVGYGPHPDEVVDVVANHEMPCVLGNHDEVVATGNGFERVNELAAATLRWTAERISPDARAYLAALPIRRRVDGGILLAHGSQTDPWTYVRRTSDAVAEIDRMDEFGEAHTLLLGHTHRPLVVTSERRAIATSEGILARRARTMALGPRTVVNPGAVGQSRELRNLARFALLDLGSRTLRLFARPYPDAETRAALRRAGLAPEACHPRPSFKKVVRQAVRDYEDRKQR
jgi:predicted phosphodiesterase